MPRCVRLVRAGPLFHPLRIPVHVDEKDEVEAEGEKLGARTGGVVEAEGEGAERHPVAEDEVRLQESENGRENAR